jgi:hypothetical protein
MAKAKQRKTQRDIPNLIARGIRNMKGPQNAHLRVPRPARRCVHQLVEVRTRKLSYQALRELRELRRIRLCGRVGRGGLSGGAVGRRTVSLSGSLELEALAHWSGWRGRRGVGGCFAGNDVLVGILVESIRV